MIVASLLGVCLCALGLSRFLRSGGDNPRFEGTQAAGGKAYVVRTRGFPAATAVSLEMNPPAPGGPRGGCSPCGQFDGKLERPGDGTTHLNCAQFPNSETG